jgi:HD superfamily phosphohydrolase
LRSVFEARYKLFKDAYLHRVCQAIDFMIVDVLMDANQVYKFHENINNPAKYVHYTDNILSLIEVSTDP